MRRAFLAKKIEFLDNWSEVRAICSDLFCPLILYIFGKCNFHLEKASFVYDAVWAPLSKWRGGGGEAVQKRAFSFSQRVFSEEVY